MKAQMLENESRFETSQHFVFLFRDTSHAQAFPAEGFLLIELSVQ